MTNKATYESALAHPRRLTTCGYGIDHKAAKQHLTSLGCPWGNSFGVWGGDDAAWQAYDAAVSEYVRTHPERWY